AHRGEDDACAEGVGNGGIEGAGVSRQRDHGDATVDAFAAGGCGRCRTRREKERSESAAREGQFHRTFHRDSPLKRNRSGCVVLCYTPYTVDERDVYTLGEMTWTSLQWQRSWVPASSPASSTSSLEQERSSPFRSSSRSEFPL